MLGNKKTLAWCINLRHVNTFPCLSQNAKNYLIQKSAWFWLKLYAKATLRLFCNSTAPITFYAWIIRFLSGLKGNEKHIVQMLQYSALLTYLVWKVGPVPFLPQNWKLLPFRQWLAFPMFLIHLKKVWKRVKLWLCLQLCHKTFHKRQMSACHLPENHFPNNWRAVALFFHKQ